MIFQLSEQKTFHLKLQQQCAALDMPRAETPLVRMFEDAPKVDGREIRFNVLKWTVLLSLSPRILSPNVLKRIQIFLRAHASSGVCRASSQFLETPKL